jgi:hypothetical protein
MAGVARTWAPWMPADELASLIADVTANPRRFKADTVAARLGITAEIRTRLDLRTIGAIDERPSSGKKSGGGETAPRRRTQAPRRRRADACTDPLPMRQPVETVACTRHQQFDVVSATQARASGSRLVGGLSRRCVRLTSSENDFVAIFLGRAPLTRREGAEIG